MAASNDFDLIRLMAVMIENGISRLDVGEIKVMEDPAVLKSKMLSANVDEKCAVTKKSEAETSVLSNSLCDIRIDQMGDFESLLKFDQQSDVCGSKQGVKPKDLCTVCLDVDWCSCNRSCMNSLNSNFNSDNKITDDGYLSDGYTRFGYNKLGEKRSDVNIRGYNTRNYDREGYNIYGYNKHGYTRNDYGEDGYNKDGFDCDGFNRMGFNFHGLTRNDYDSEGYDSYGHDCYGFDKNGRNWYGLRPEDYDENGLDKFGYNYNGFYKVPQRNNTEEATQFSGEKVGAPSQAVAAANLASREAVLAVTRTLAIMAVSQAQEHMKRLRNSGV
ncbi:uncharacterized protein [Procambarus clarkii]|uniref:uncharacterized protein n=1 Tax=Procambarus clarkii TaxID=6728 RepID=UPI0037442682